MHSQRLVFASPCTFLVSGKLQSNNFGGFRKLHMISIRSAPQERVYGLQRGVLFTNSVPIEHRLNAKGRRRGSWWKKLFLDEIDDSNDIALWEENSDNGAVNRAGEMPTEEEEEEDAFKVWKQKIEAINDLRWQRGLNNKDWEDWLDDSWHKKTYYASATSQESPSQPPAPSKAEEKQKRAEEEQKSEREMLIKYEEELRLLRTELENSGKKRKRSGPFSDLFQDRVQENRYEKRLAKSAAKSTVKFAACLIIVPWMADFVVHDFVLVPFLKKYVDLVPLASKAFDVTDSQKRKKVIPPLKDEQTRLTLEAELGVAPPLTDEELHKHLHKEALKLLEEVRAENRSNFAYIWSDLVAGIALFLLLIFNPVQVEVMSYTGSRIVRNLSDIGKAFFIILLSDIFLGYHSESGWVTVVELVLEHYGVEATEASISSFVAIVPVTIDACFKLWVFRNLPRLSPSLTAVFREMERH